MITHVGLLDDHTNVTGSELVIVALSELPVDSQSGADAGALMLQMGTFTFSFTITSAKQVLAEFCGSVIVKRYVPGAEIKIESRPTLSLIPAPMDTLFSVQSNTGLTMSVE